MDVDERLRRKVTSVPEVNDQEPKQSIQLRLLNSVSTRLQSLMDSDQFFQNIVDIIKHKLNYYVIQIWVRTPEGSIKLKGQTGAYQGDLKIDHTIAVPTGGITGHVFTTKQTYVTNDVSKDPYFTSLSVSVATKSQICIPILKDGEVLGTLNIESDRANAFDEDDIITLEAVASQVAVATTNRRMFKQIKNFNDNLRTAVEEKTHELREAHQRILEHQRLLKRENIALKNLVNKGNESLQLIGQSPAVLNILTMVDKIAPTTATVLIQGESGTGKELIARRLHFKSDRADRPYVTVNCGALQESLLESELFGHERGSFTGAVGQKIGLVETAEGGTLFLDEIGELTLGIQSKLLRFLQEGEFYRIGGKKPLKIELRVVSATNRDLEQEVAAGRFREDLFYRLNTITLRMPPLRKRKEDLNALVDFFIKNSRFGGPNQNVRKVDPKVYEIFQNYDWPGNIRELQNTVERMKILSEGPVLTVEDIPSGIRSPKGKSEPTVDFQVGLTLEDIEKNTILRSLAYHHGNKTRTAEALGITVKTLYNKLNRYGVMNNSEQAAQDPNQAKPV